MTVIRYLLAFLLTTCLASSVGLGQMNGDQFFIGSNNFGQNADTYLAGEECGVTTPTPSGDLGAPLMHAIIILNGTDDEGPVRLSHNDDEMTVLAINSISCSLDGVHAGTSYYREFSLSTNSVLNLANVELGVEMAMENFDGSGTDNDGLIPIQVCLYYDTPLAAITHSGVNGPSGFDEAFCRTVPGDGSVDLSVITIPLIVTVPAGTSSLVVEIFTPGFDTDPETDFCFDSDNSCDFTLGDVNQDNSIDLLDVAPFIQTLSNGSFICEADINEDDIVNLLDVDPFVAILAGG